MDTTAMCFVILREGGYVNDPQDRGGATNFGITHKTLASWRGVKAVTPQEVRDMRLGEAVSIYERNYWQGANCHKIKSPQLALCLFDAAVNHGPRQAIRFLQEACGAVVDGIWGTETETKANTVDQEQALVKYIQIRANFFRRLAGRDASQQKFLRGWLIRCRAVARECGVTVNV